MFWGHPQSEEATAIGGENVLKSVAENSLTTEHKILIYKNNIFRQLISIIFL